MNPIKVPHALTPSDNTYSVRNLLSKRCDQLETETQKVLYSL